MAEMVNREVGEDADGVDRDEPSHNPAMDNEGEQEQESLESMMAVALASSAIDNEAEDQDRGAGDQDSSSSSHLSFESFEQLPLLERLEKYALTPNFNRNMVGGLFLETLKAYADSPPDVASVLWILYNMSESPYQALRIEVMDHIPHIAMMCHTEREKLLYVVNHLLPLVAKQLTHDDDQIRKAAQVTLLVLMDQCLVGQAAVEEIVCPVVNVLSGPDQHPDSAVQLMSKIAPFLGREATERLFLARFCDLCHDENMQVRKMCAVYFGEFCAVVGQSTFEEVLLCRFVDLCQDDEPGVRKACAEVIMSVSCACSLQRRKTVLAPMFVTLLWDAVRWVRLSAFRTLGPFISTFAVPCVANVVYDENGELVLVNREGCEFRLNKGDIDDGWENVDGGTDKTSDDSRSESNNPEKRTFNGDKTLQDFKRLEFKAAKNKRLRVRDCRLTRFINDLSGAQTASGDAVEYSSESSDCPTEETDLDDSEKKIFNGDKTSKEQFETGSTSSNIQSSGPLARFFNEFDAARTASGDALEYSSESSDCVTLETDLDDFSHSQGDEASENSSDKATPASTPSEEWDFNSFQYWRVPIPDIPNINELNLRDLSNPSVDCHDVNSSKECDIDESRSIRRIRQNEDRFLCDERKQNKKRLNDAIAEQDIVPHELVEMFASMTHAEIALHCAFSLPAVALTLGRENWGCLRKTYETLAADMQWKVRRIVANCIHELAEILGGELAAKDLVPIYMGLIEDLDEVRIGALKHLAEFVMLLPSAERKFFLDEFEKFLVTDNEWNWRFREELAQQLLRIIPLYTPIETNKHLIPVAIALLRDKVAAVRSSALLLVAGLVNHVTTEVPLLRKLLPQLAEEFARSGRWERRQAFALLCSHLVSGRVLGGDQFAREVLPFLLELSNDTVPNVRLAVAKTLASDIMAQEYFSGAHQEVVMQVLKRLINDKDRDVRFFADPNRGSSSQISHQVPSSASQLQPSC